MIFNVKNYKLAKIFTSDLAVIIKEVESNIEKLSPFMRYSPVKRLLPVLKNELAVLKAHEEACKRVVDTKGQVKEEVQGNEKT